MEMMAERVRELFNGELYERVTRLVRQNSLAITRKYRGNNSEQPRSKILCLLLRGRSRKNMYRSLARIIVWENAVFTLCYLAIFSIVYWFLACWGVRSFVAACSAAMVALPLACTVEPPDEADDVEDEAEGDVTFTRGTDGRVLPQPRDLTWDDVRLERNWMLLMTLFFEKFKVISNNYLQEEQDNPMKLCFAAFICGMLAFLVKVNVSSAMVVYGFFMFMYVSPGVVFGCRISDTPKESDTEIEEFVFAVTEDNFKVLNRAGETGDHSPTPPSLDTSATNDFFTEELPGAMPSHTMVISEDELRMVEEALALNFSSGPLLSESRLDGSSSSSEDEEISLKPKKITEVNVEDDDDDSSDELNDFEIIEAEEIADINNRNNV